MSSLLSSSIDRVRCLADEEADHNMLQDLHLAAELGKTLLERNKELENSIKNYQSTIDDQALEIEYLKKQVAAMKEVNNSRLKVYENLETVINDLEHMNQQLESERSKDKSKITSLRKVIDEVQNKYHDLEDKYETIKRDREVSFDPMSPNSRLDGSIQNDAVSTSSTSDSEVDDLIGLKRQLQELQEQRSSGQDKLSELVEQIANMTQEKLETQDQMKELQIELSQLKKDNTYLEQIRKSQMCQKCKMVINRGNETPSLRIDDDNIDESSLHHSLSHIYEVEPSFALHQEELGAKVARVALEEDSSCREPYRMLVEKYEALVKVHQNAPRRKHSGYGLFGDFRMGAPASAGGCGYQPPTSGGLSLQEELQMSGEFNSNLTTSAESGLGGGGVSPRSSSQKLAGKPFAGTPTDFSEAETSSSGFADETSNKATQTEGRPGSFLCSIADGDDCHFSIYDDTSTFESRFHQTPEYRKLFSEIFEVLKRAAEAKDVLAGPSSADSEQLLNQTSEDALTPVAEQQGSFGLFEDAPSETTDDANSVVSLAVSSVASEPVFRVRTPLFSRRQQHHQQHQQQLQEQQQQQQSTESSARPLHVNTRRQPLEYLSVQVRKRGSGKRGRRGAEGSPAAADVIPTTNPRVSQLRAGTGGRRKFRPLTASELSDGGVWNGSTTHFYPSKLARAARQQQQQQQRNSEQEQQANGHASAGSYKPGLASEEVAKLRRLEMSYAEALRMPNKSKAGSSPRQRRHH